MAKDSKATNEMALVDSSLRASLIVTIVGAGIGGLMAAIGLAKNGHTVNVCRVKSQRDVLC